MSKAVIIKELTSQLIQMNFVCAYHPRNDIYSDMFFECQNSDEEPSKINLKLAVSVDEKSKQLKYAHRISEYTTSDHKNRVHLLDPIEGFHQFVSYQTITGKTKHIYLDPEELVELIENMCKKHEYTFVRIDNIDLSMSKQIEKRPVKQSVPVLSIVTLLILSALSLLFQLTPKDWIISLVLAILFILSIQMIPQKRLTLMAGWITLQMLIWFLY
ncbi:MAG: hypothetical protein CVU94_09525 [Firmicutes bacterium HGW-Firmicutes-19]|jgi:hypothetical protein|nr:MAG: hypothetical protein CVU94_09525 [Firmicutes bacterium HGW-Firmicutes-19]